MDKVRKLSSEEIDSGQYIITEDFINKMKQSLREYLSRAPKPGFVESDKKFKKGDLVDLGGQ